VNHVVLTHFAQRVLFGENIEKTVGNNCCLICCAYSLLVPCYLCWIPHCIKRKDLREKYGLEDDPSCGDFSTTGWVRVETTKHENRDFLQLLTDHLPDSSVIVFLSIHFVNKHSP
jgi:Cys-rich protein (TIGR01571 family)